MGVVARHGECWWSLEAECPPQRARFGIWIVLLSLGACGLWALAELFPGSVSTSTDRAYLVYYLGFLAVLASGVVASRRYKFTDVARNTALWIGIAGVLALAYTFQNDLEDIGIRLRSALIPGYAVAVNANELVLSESEGGNFYAFGAVNGTEVRFLIDTGASDIVLSPVDAQRVGIDIRDLDYLHVYETANGAGHGAPATVATLSVGPIALSDVAVSVNQAPMSNSLLGMTFLKRLKSFAIRNHRLYLRWRD